jgi:hypothetical protein
VSSIGSSALAAANDAGKWIGNAESAVVDEVLAHPAAVAKGASELNSGWGGLVDSAEKGIMSLTKGAVDATSDIPVLSNVVQSAAFIADASTESLGGTAKGLGDLVTAGTTAAANPLAPIEGLLSMGEHVPGIAGTALKGAHGLYDIATGNEKGEYGKDLGELWGNLSDGDKQSEQDLKFWAQLGGGEQAWNDKPLEAGMRTLTNLAPMFLGEFIGEPTAPRVIEPTEFGPPKGGGGGARGGAGGGGARGGGGTPDLPPSSEGPSTRPYGPEFFDKPPDTIRNPEGPPTERGMDTLRGVAEQANWPVESPRSAPIEEAPPGRKTPVGQGSGEIALEEIDAQRARLRAEQGYPTEEQVKEYLRRNPPKFPPDPDPFKP